MRPSLKLSNYLRTYRKRSGLSQDDVAFLLGARSGPQVCRYERFVSEPNLATALVCEVIFRTPVSELFAGLLHEAERDTLKRVQVLARKLASAPASRRRTKKLEVLSGIAAASRQTNFTHRS